MNTRRSVRVLRNGVSAMRRNRLRTFLMSLGTFIGVTVLAVVVAIGRGTQQDLLSRMQRMLGGSTILLRGGGGHARVGPHAPATNTVTLDDVRAIDGALDVVIAADPMFMSGDVEVVYQGRDTRIRIVGHSDAAERVWNRSVTRGSYFTAGDVASAARVALVGEVVVRDLFDGRDPIGEQIRIGGIPFSVLGVLAHEGIDPHGLDKDNEIIIPISTMMRRVRNVDYVQSAKFLLKPDADLGRAVPDIGEILRRRHSLGPDQPDDFQTFTPVQAEARVREASRTFTVFIPLAAAACILIGALVVANLMLLNVHERRAEIGLRRAVGARDGDIRLQFLAEAAAVTGLGGISAVGAAVGILQFLAAHAGTPAALSWPFALLAVGVSMAVGLLAGLLPARRAASLDPVYTLR